MIEFENVTKLYGTVIGVNDVSLSLPKGGYGLLGPNGSGKTTLLNLLTGQLNATLGTVKVDNECPRNNHRLLRRIGYCPSVEGFYPNIPGVEWVQFLLELQGVRRGQAQEQAEAAMDQVGMSDAMQRPIGSYSRGMRQRTKLAQAFAHDPELLILDEPFNGLDPVARHDMTRLLRDWIQKGRGLIVASHVLHEIEAITPSFMLICGGRLLASGDARDVHELLADVPNELTIHCDRPRDLARRLIDAKLVESVRLGEHGNSLQVTTRSAANLYGRLPAMVNGSGVRGSGVGDAVVDHERIAISEIRAADDSLQTLFEKLMRIHRGEQ